MLEVRPVPGAGALALDSALLALSRLLYPGRRQSVLWFLVALIATAVVAWRVAPRSWRTRSLPVLALASVVAYFALTTGFHTGFIQWLDHDVFEQLRGGVDDVATWVVAAGGAFVGSALAAALTKERRH